MYNRQFFASRLGKAAMLSIVAMAAFNLVTVLGQIDLGVTHMATVESPVLAIA